MKQADHQTEQVKGIVLILIGAVLIGLMPTSARFAYDDGANALSVLFGRSVIGVVVLLAYILFRQMGNALSVTNLRQSLWPGITHVFSAFGILASIVYIDISVANVIVFLFPFPVAIIAHIRGDTLITPAIIALMVVSLVGLVMVLGVDTSSLDPRGLAIAVLGMFSITAMIMAMSDLTRKVGAPHSNLLMTIWAVLIFGAVAVAGPLSGLIDAPKFPQTTGGWFALFCVGVTFSLGYLCFFISASIIGAARASLLSISEPVMIILFAVLLVGERLSPVQWIGAVLVFTSLALTEVVRK